MAPTNERGRRPREGSPAAPNSQSNRSTSVRLVAARSLRADALQVPNRSVVAALLSFVEDVITSNEGAQ